MESTSEFDDLEYGMASSGGFTGDYENGDDDYVLDPAVPTPSVHDNEQGTVADKSDLPDTKAMVKHLVECGKEMGVQVDKEMINVVMSSASIYEFSEDSMRWFILGITFMNNKRIVPEFGEILNNLRTEIKSLQQTNTAIKTSASDITKKMVSVKDEVLDGFEKLRAGVIDKVMELEEVKLTDTKPKGITEPKSVGINIINEHSKPSQSAPSVKRDKAPVVKPLENPVIADKVKILVSVGGNKKLISKMDEDELNLYITDTELAELIYGDSEELKNDLKDEILLRLDDSELI
ncbi:TPA_asm: phosphoprotein [Bacopa monnieri virus 1]|uniref:Phosphoprotein n=1 Tax=Bacopa monnieri virus 1 TaxID=2813287 RepID=A0AAD2KPP8_9RHAB|nr:phosphoprotein [Bacopa monnieri virus 1]DAF42443.1 TPA_asm: phosphoprotein [Bacopa monnieri virus 1]